MDERMNISSFLYKNPPPDFFPIKTGDHLPDRTKSPIMGWKSIQQ